MNYSDKINELEAVLLRAGFKKIGNNYKVPEHYFNMVDVPLLMKIGCGASLVDAVTIYAVYLRRMHANTELDKKSPTPLEANPAKP